MAANPADPGPAEAVGRAPRRGRRLLLAAILAACVGCDGGTKRLASERLRGSPPLSLLGGAVRVQYALNPGGFLGLGADLPAAPRFLLVTGVNAAFLGVLAWVLIRRRDMAARPFLAWGLILGGGLGNLADRLLRDGQVVDFLHVGLGPFRSGIFNAADVLITAGACLLLLDLALGRGRGSPSPYSSDEGSSDGTSTHGG